MTQTTASPPQVPSADLLAGEKALHFPLGTTLPELGQALEVAEGVWWIRMALPFALDHINLWLLADAEETPTGLRHGWTVVDCGVTNPGTQEAWRQVMAGPMKGLSTQNAAMSRPPMHNTPSVMRGRSTRGRAAVTSGTGAWG